MDKILLSGLTFFGRHGCHAWEREGGQKFIVDIEVECDLQAAGTSDALEDTVDYVSIYNATREIMEGEPALLLESLAQRIADSALRDEKVQAARVRIRKPHIALPATLDYLGVEIRRERERDKELER